MEKTKNEIRFNTGLRIREAEGENGNNRTIEGCAIVFNRESQVLDDWGTRFTEIIAPSCIGREELNSDIKLNLLHERKDTVARHNADGTGNLQLELREDGLYFSFEAPKCDIGDRALEMVRSGVYTGCSFEFYPKDYTTEKRGGEELLITHTKFERLSALTIGMDPAYTATFVNAREVIGEPKQEEDQEQQKREEEEQEKQRRIIRQQQERDRQLFLMKMHGQSEL